MGAPEVSWVLRDARLIVHFGGRYSPRGCSFSPVPPARSPVELDAHARRASLLRGGDGTAASLDGGAIEILPTPGSEAGGERHELSVCIRVCDPTGRCDGDILSEYGRDGTLRYALTAGEKTIDLDFRTDYREEPLHLEAVLDLVGRTEWHDIVVRYSGHHLELLIDAVLVDEDWPVGTIAGAAPEKLVAGARPGPKRRRRGYVGLVEHLFVWDRALSDREVELLSGGSAKATAHGWAVPSARGPQYAEAPRGGYVGDCLPFFHDDVYHFYYLYDRRNHRSKYGLGAHQWAHSSSRDLVDWEQHPIAIPVSDQKEGSICTGSVFVHEGTWYGFYATRMLDRSEHLSLATSRDGIYFEKIEPNPIASPAPPYKPGPFRDPHVFRDPTDGTFHMLVTAELAEPPAARRGGCLAHLVSKDLRVWEQRAPFLVTGYADQPECSELFEWRGWHYLVFSHFGRPHYRMSRSPFGPWEKPPVDTFDGPQARVMKSARFTDDRRIGAAFLAKGKGYAGCAVFREYLQQPDGTLATRWPPEMVPPTGDPLDLRVEPLSSAPAAAGFTIDARAGFAWMALERIPRAFLLRFIAAPEPGTHAYGIGVRGTGKFEGALTLEIEPQRRKVGWRRAEDPAWRENESAAIYEVGDLDKAVSIAIFAVGDVFDVCINDRRTLVSRHATADGEALFFYCHDGRARFTNIEVRPIVPAAT